MLPIVVLLAAVLPLRPPVHGTGDVAWPTGLAAARGATPVLLEEDTQYPRKHTLYLNFRGGVLSFPSFSGSSLFDDNSAEDVSLLVDGSYVDWPAFAGTEQTAIAVAESVANDMAAFGIRVVYLERPSKIVPYTMAMIGGSYSLLGLEEASGHAPYADCGAVNQRHVVFSYVDGGTAVEQANIISQEAGHAWGLDHIFGADHVMSYEGFSGDKHFADECTELCEAECQGPGTVGCLETHAEFCPPGQQNDMAELEHLFGGPEPDVEAPTIELVEPLDGAWIPLGDDIPVLATLTDDYGGFGWKLVIEHDGEIVYDRVDYQRRGEWYILAPEEGDWTLTIEAEDHADHVTMASITVHVGEPGEGSTGTGEGSDEGSTTADATGGGLADESGESGSDTSGAAAVGELDDGCNCRAAGSRSTLVPWLLPVLVWGVRRRSPAT